MVVHPRENDLVVGTHGRSIWILDDLAPLEDLATGSVFDKNAHLFPVAGATQWFRMGGWPFRGDVYEAENPPDGAVIRYWLAEGVDSATLSVTSEDGGPVRTLEATAGPGVNQVVWDLREDAPVEMPEGQDGGPGGGGFGGGAARPPGVAGRVRGAAGGGRPDDAGRTWPCGSTRGRAPTWKRLQARQEAARDVATLNGTIALAARALRRLSEQLEAAEDLLRVAGGDDGVGGRADVGGVEDAGETEAAGEAAGAGEGADPGEEAGTGEGAEAAEDATEDAGHIAALKEQAETLAAEVDSLQRRLQRARPGRAASGIERNAGPPSKGQLLAVAHAWEQVPALVEQVNEYVEERVPEFPPAHERSGRAAQGGRAGRPPEPSSAAVLLPIGKRLPMPLPILRTHSPSRRHPSPSEDPTQQAIPMPEHAMRIRFRSFFATALSRRPSGALALAVASVVATTASLDAQRSGASAQGSAASNASEEALVGRVAARSLGPAVMSGRVVDIAVAMPNWSAYDFSQRRLLAEEIQPGQIVYIAAATGGVWKSTSGGVAWEPVFDDAGVGSIGDVTLAPSDPNIVWVGTGEPNNMRSSSYGDGVYKSEDGGATFRHMGLRTSQHVGRIVVSPDDPNTVYVAAVGPLWGAGGELGRLQDHRRRRDLGGRPDHRPAYGRDRSRDASQKFQGALRLGVATGAPGLQLCRRRSRQRHLQDH